MSAPRAIGVDCGGTKILAGVVGRDGTVDRRHTVATPTSSEEDLLEALEGVVETLLGEDVAAIGMGVPSQIDQRTGRAVSSVHVPLSDVDLRGRMRDRFGLPVGIDNDGNVAAIAEWQLGAGKGASNVVLLTLGTGIGGGLILDGRPFRGSVGGGAELGHMVLDYGGPPCKGDCTGHGHFEAFAAGSAANALARARFGEHADARRLVDAAEGGNQGAISDLAELGHRLGAGIGSLVNIFNPELVIIGGGFADAGELILGPARETLAVEGLPLPREVVRIVLAELGHEAGMVGAALVGFETLDESTLAVPLAVCATPIGNLDDVTLRVLDELRAADVVLCEDTRHTRGLLTRHGIEARLLSYHEHNEAKRTAEVLPRLAAGERVALVSDAGMPGISDPGARLVGAAIEAGIPVTVLPGPSAVETAVAASGFEVDRYQFVGFLPRGAAELSALWRDLAQWRHALVAFESPNRLPRTLASLADALPDRPVAVCRELTKRFEEVVRGPASEAAERLAEGVKGEITLVIGPADVEPGVDESEALEAVADLVRAGSSRKAAADAVSRLTGVPKKRLYDASL